MAVTEASDLYGLPLDRFVAERGALAKALRAEGNKDEAARVGSLRKPSVAAWTVNQVIRTQRRAVRALLATGDELERAQSDILAGRGDAGALRDAAPGGAHGPAARSRAEAPRPGRRRAGRGRGGAARSG